MHAYTFIFPVPTPPPGDEVKHQIYLRSLACADEARTSRAKPIAEQVADARARMKLR